MPGVGVTWIDVNINDIIKPTFNTCKLIETIADFLLPTKRRLDKTSMPTNDPYPPTVGGYCLQPEY